MVLRSVHGVYARVIALPPSLDQLHAGAQGNVVLTMQADS